MSAYGAMDSAILVYSMASILSNRSPLADVTPGRSVYQTPERLLLFIRPM